MNGRESLDAWVAEAEKAAAAAFAAKDKAYDAYLAARQHYDRSAAIAGNRRAVRDKRSYTPFPGVGTKL